MFDKEVCGGATEEEGGKLNESGEYISKKYSPSCITYISPCITW